MAKRAVDAEFILARFRGFGITCIRVVIVNRKRGYKHQQENAAD
jgi:hypothetical protein